MSRKLSLRRATGWSAALALALALSVPTAALGGTVEIPTIDGKAKILKMD